jgi:hypothetical protein
MALTDKFAVGDKGTLTEDVLDSADHLTALLLVAPLEMRRELDELINEFEDLRCRVMND